MRIYLLLASIILVSCKDNNANKAQSEDYETPESSALNIEQSIAEGQILYEDFCLQCHMANGKGITGTFPPLADSDWLTDKIDESIHAIKFGLSGEITVNGVSYNSVMTPMGLSDQEIADLMNYTMNAWGNSSKEVITAKRVSEVEK